MKTNENIQISLIQLNFNEYFTTLVLFYICILLNLKNQLF